MGSQPANPASPVKARVERWTAFRFCQRRCASIARLLNRRNAVAKRQRDENSVRDRAV
jgi:hypothetical protein